MLMYVDGQRAPERTEPDEEHATVVLVAYDTLARDAQHLKRPYLLSKGPDERATRFESHPMYDCLTLNIPNKGAGAVDTLHRVAIYYEKRIIVIVHEPMQAVDKLIALLDGRHGERPLAYEQVLYAFLGLLTEFDTQELETIENAVTALEDDVQKKPSQDQLDEISRIRKYIMADKRYFESLLAALEDQEENTNRFLTSTQMRSLRIVKDRVERLVRSVLNLREDVTHVREAYQSQMDIALNRTMQLFTVITAIFSPLTLLVGWYGMNFDMPEYAWPFAYPLVAVVSGLIVLVSVVLFRRKRWF